MGMDVYGQNPTAEVGTYFRNNCWWWHPLWSYVLDVAPWVGEKVRYGRFNCGDGLPAAESARLAEILSEELRTGRTAEYALDYMCALIKMPDQVCSLCKGRGQDRPRFAFLRKASQQTCHVCQGSGRERPAKTHYPFTVENVVEFRNFLVACGGFEIW